MTAEKKEQLIESAVTHYNLLNVVELCYGNLLSEEGLGKIMSITYCEICLQVTGEPYYSVMDRLANHLRQDKNNIEKPRQYYSVCDLKNLNAIAERLIDYLENYNLRIENDTQFQKIVKQVGIDWRSEGNVPKKINFD